MRLVHEECGGDLEIDRSMKVEVRTKDNHTDLWYGIRCIGCGQHLGLLPNVDTAIYPAEFDSNCRRYFS